MVEGRIRQIVGGGGVKRVRAEVGLDRSREKDGI